MGCTLFVLAITGAGCGLENGSIFFPDQGITKTPSDVGLKYEDLYITTPDGIRINAWFVPFPDSRTSILWFHGNGGNLSHRVQSILLSRAKLQINILMIDYRQYGKSEGNISEEGTYQDAVAAYDYLANRRELDTDPIIIYGHSLGAAVAVELATRRPAQGLILEAPFTSIKDMAKETLPWLPIGPLLLTRYDSYSKMDRIGTPLLVLHGDQDETVPYEHGRRIFEAAKEPKTFYTIPGSGHNNARIIGGKPYFEVIRRFIDSLRGPHQ